MNAKRLAIKRIEQKFKEDFGVLNNYTMELKTTNPDSSVVVVSESRIPMNYLYSIRYISA